MRAPAPLETVSFEQFDPKPLSWTTNPPRCQAFTQRVRYAAVAQVALVVMNQMQVFTIFPKSGVYALHIVWRD